MKLTPLRTYPLFLVVTLALWGCAAGQPGPASSGAPEPRSDEPVSPPIQVAPEPGGVSVDDTAGKPDDAPIEMSDVKLVLEAILPMRANGWTETLGYAGLYYFDELPKDTELLIVYLPPRLFDLGPAKHMCWGSALLVYSDETIKDLVKNLPPELRPGSYLRIVGFYYRDGEIQVAFAITEVQSGLEGVEFKSVNVMFELGISKVNGKILAQYKRVAVR